MKPSENLAAARIFLLEHGHSRSVSVADDGSVCAIAALDAVGVPESEVSFEIQCLAQAAGLETDTVYEICNHNWDVPDVDDWFRRAELIAKEAEA